ncbi:MAG: cbb3-type cytochrome oxidase assembly protein CcoS [Verrucomicrobiota bacterium]
MIAATLVLLVLVGITGSALIAFWWAADTGQFKNPEDASKSIFDRDESIGKPTDHFPGRSS